MIRLTAIIILSFFFSGLNAQYGNEWITYGQLYVKIPVAKDGIYRISYASLQNAGLPVNALDPKKIQVFHRGNEQSILVLGESDNNFDPPDYVEFYGRKNDGTLDTELYASPALQPHGYHNLFSDTTSYFLTIGSSNGKRAQSYDDTNLSLSPLPYHLDEKILLKTNVYSEGRDYGDIIKSTFDEGEGWMGPLITQGQIEDDTVKSILRTISSAGKPVLHMVMTGRGPMQHLVEVYIGSSSRLLTSLTMSGYESRTIIQEIEWSDLNPAGHLRVGIKVNISDAASARVSVNYIKLRYAQEIDMAANAEFKMTIPSTTDGRALIEIKNPVSNTRLFDISDPNDPLLIGTDQSTVLSAVIRSTTTERKLFATAQYIEPEIKSKLFYAFNPEEINYLIISHPLLRKPAGTYSDPVQAYADYRSSVEGGGYFSQVLDITELYDQFNYGEQSPLAIFHLMKYLAATHLPDYLFFIGKGLDVDYDYFRKPESTVTYKTLVPTAGMPSSDIAFTAGLAGEEDVPAIPTGRITAMKPEEVAAYLNKVKEAEARPFNDLRRKNVLHLSGGIYRGEAQKFQSYLQDFGETAEAFYLGGKVDAIAKESTNIKLINISDEVNKGLALVTFFGHSSRVTLDFDVGYVTDEVMGYHNKGKYPVLLMNGCYVGSFFRYAKLFGEDWISALDRGAVGFIAHSSLGFPTPLKKYSGLFYEVGFGDSLFITKGLGDIQNEVARRFLKNSAHTPLEITQVQQMILLGDPAVRLFGASNPDYAIRDENLSVSSLNEQPVTVASDSFAVNFIVKNFGQAKNEPLSVHVIRTLNDRSTITYDSIYPPVLYADTLRFIIKDKLSNGFGNNTFEIQVDGEEIINEITENNNSAYIDYFIPENGTQSLYPGKFSIVSNTDLTLTFQHTNLLSSDREYVVELDTVLSFDSPFKSQYTVNATVLARQPVVLLNNDSLVYYWRNKIAVPLENESKEWEVSSFTYIADGPEGWAQSHFQQYLENASTGLLKDVEAREFRFEETVTPLSILTYGGMAGQPASAVSVKIGNAEYNLTTQGFECRSNTINLIAFDRHSTVPYPGIQFKFTNRAGRACGREPWAINSFIPTELVTGNGDDIIQYVNNIPVGDSVVLFNIGDAGYAQWPSDAKIKLGELGISVLQIEQLLPGEPVVMLGRKGLTPGTARIIRVETGSPANEELVMNGTITGRYTSGEMRSVIIGPALAWHALYFNTSGSDNEDNTSVDVYGITTGGRENLLLDSIQQSSQLNEINNVEYPYLRLVYKTEDDVNLTPEQLRKWIVTYEPAPEGLIFYAGLRNRETLNEGEVWIGNYGFVNVSDKDFSGPLAVNYKILNHSSFTSSQKIINIPPPPAGDTTIFTIEVDSYKKTGLNDIEVFVNPFILREQSFTNNVLVLNEHLNVSGETYDPVLDITVDGRYIDKDEYVSAAPKIVIRLWDENRILLKKDTTSIDVFMALDCVGDLCDFARINFRQSDVQWFPATDTSDFKILYSPLNLVKGRYTLRVTAKDQSENPSGIQPYEITFVIADEREIILSEPFPNPVLEDLKFRITFTDAVPENLTLEIISMKGDLVQTLIPDDITGLHSGNNILTWKVLDAGRILFPSGIYIYRLTLNMGNKTFTKRGKLSMIH